MFLKRLNANAASADRLRQGMLRDGMTMKGDKLWTDDELQVVAEYYPDFETLERLLPYRSHMSLWYAAGKAGVRREQRAWTSADVARMRKVWHSATHEELLSMFPGTTWEGLRSFAGRHGFRRRRRPYKPTGSPILDQIRARCYEIGWTMIDLDAEAGTCRYFEHIDKQHTQPNPRAVAKAVKALGGELVAKWNDD